MPILRTVYTREELLRIAALASGIEVSPGIISKFDLIEVAEPAAIYRRREVDIANPGAASENSSSVVGGGGFSSNPSKGGASSSNGTANNNNGNTAITNSSNANNTNNNGNGAASHSNTFPTPLYSARNASDGRRGGGNSNGNNGNGRDDGNRGAGGGNSNNNSSHGNSSHRRSGEESRAAGHDRFAPPEGRFGRGNRNQETFEFGVEYELQQSAMQKQRVTETMEREDRRGEQLKQALEKFKQVDKEPEPKVLESKETDEIERLLAGLTMGDDVQPKAVVRSRFFSAQTETTPAAAPPPPPLSAPSAAAPMHAPSSQQQLQQSSLQVDPNASLSVLGNGSGMPSAPSAPQSKVLLTADNSGASPYPTRSWSNVKSDTNLWATSPSMKNTLKQSAQASNTGAVKSSQSQSKPGSQPPQPPTPPAVETPSQHGLPPPPPTHGGGAPLAYNVVPAPAGAGLTGSSIAAMGFKTSVLGPSNQQTRPASTGPTGGGANVAPTPSRAWTAADLEQMLMRQARQGGAAANSIPNNNAGGGAAAMSKPPLPMQAQLPRQAPPPPQMQPQQLAQPQQHQQPAPPQFMTAVKTPPMMPQGMANPAGGFICGMPPSPPQQLPTSGKMPPSPSMLPHTLPQQQQLQQQHHQLPPPPPPITSQQQQQASKMPPPPQMAQPSLPMPIIMNAQGQYFAAPPQQQQFFMPGQAVMFRRPDGTVFMQPQQAQPPQQQQQFNPFATNAQYLFQQQQQQQQRR